MKLFDKDKDLIHRILNLILVVWFVGALFFVTSNLINVFVKEPSQSYEEFKSSGCTKYYYDYLYYDDTVTLTEEEQEAECKRSYESYKLETKNNEYYNYKGLYLALGNVFIVGAFLLLLNPIKIKKTTKKNKNK